jgi:hypothetical protein
MLFFLNELQHNPSGRRYRKAWEQSQLALKAIAHTPSDRLDAARRLYIQKSNEASAALSYIEGLYSWPPDAVAAKDFIYHPPGSAQRRSRKGS